MTVVTIVIDKTHSDMNTFIATDVEDKRDIEYTFARKIERMTIAMTEAVRAKNKETNA